MQAPKLEGVGQTIGFSAERVGSNTWQQQRWKTEVSDLNLTLTSVSFLLLGWLLLIMERAQTLNQWRMGEVIP